MEQQYSLPRLTHHWFSMLLKSPRPFPLEPLSSIFLTSGLKHYCGSRALRLLGSNHWQGSEQTKFDACSLPRRRITDLIHFRSGVSLFTSATLARTESTAFCFQVLLFSPYFHMLHHPLLCSPPLPIWLNRALKTSPRSRALNFNFISAVSCRCAKGYNDRKYFCNQRSSPRRSLVSISRVQWAWTQALHFIRCNKGLIVFMKTEDQVSFPHCEAWDWF